MAYLHEHKDFKSLLDIVADEMGIEAGLVEKDYWIMHTLYGLKKQGFQFELKGGTSLSKGFQIIDRFSEDIDIHITPDPEMNVTEDHRKIKKSHIDSRAAFFEWLVKNIQIDGIISQERDHEFDNNIFTSGGIRLYYENKVDKVEGTKESHAKGYNPSTKKGVGSSDLWPASGASEIKKSKVAPFSSAKKVWNCVNSTSKAVGILF